MQTMFIAAGVIALVTGIVHSVLGEILIFKQLRVSGLVPTLTTPQLRERNIRIIWATWHLASVFGWAFAGILLQLAFAPNGSSTELIVNAVVFANLAGSALVLIGTKGRHPGWVALLLVAVFTWFGASAT